MLESRSGKFTDDPGIRAPENNQLLLVRGSVQCDSEGSAASSVISRVQGTSRG
jgi:hypothetical protein